MENLLSEQEAIDLIKERFKVNVAKSTFRHWRHTGKLRYLYFVKSALFREDHLMEDIKSLIKEKNTKRVEIKR